MNNNEMRKLLESENVLGKGLKPHIEDERDHDYAKVCGGFFDLFNYKPKSTRMIIPTISTKNQMPHNICGWASSTLQKEKYENVPLSVQGLVMIGMREGKISGNGFSALRDNQALIQKFGIPEDSFFAGMNSDNWSVFSDHKKLTSQMIENAKSHRSASYAKVIGKNNILQALDNGNILQTGLDWYNEFNMGGGFTTPWIIEKKGRNLIGGHAFDYVGYDVSYHGIECLIAKQSLGPNWGDNSYFYVPLEYAMNECYAFYTQTDIPVDVAGFLNSYQLKFVKGNFGAAVYQIMGNEKLSFPNPETLASYTGQPVGDYSMIEPERIDVNILNAITTSSIDITQTKYWQLIKSFAKTPERYQLVLNAIKEEQLKTK